MQQQQRGETAVPLPSPPLITNAQGRATAVSPYRASQDDGRQTRFLLTDGLGSVRTEMVGGAVETTTTYEPYGNLLTQTGTSGTVYGYTGEQEDAATGLVYLRRAITILR